MRHPAPRPSGCSCSVVVSVIAGFILLVAVTFAIPTRRRARRGANVVTYIWQTSMSTHWAEFLLFIIVVAQFYCLTACVTSGSRMLFAFSRDRAVPGHQACGAGSRGTACRSGRSRRFRPPASCCSYRRGGTTYAGYYVGTSVGTTGLYIAFILPVILRLPPR